jgi:hypothetical protein
MRKRYIYLLIGSFSVTLVLLLTLFFPIFSKQFGLEDVEKTVKKDDISISETIFYNDAFIPPSNSFGISNFTQEKINWVYLDNNTKYSLSVNQRNASDLLFINYTDIETYRKYSYEFTSVEQGYYIFNMVFDSKTVDCWLDDENKIVYFNYSNDKQLFYDFSDNGILNISIGQFLSSGIKVVYDPTFGGTGNSIDVDLHSVVGNCFMYGTRGTVADGDGTVDKISVGFGTLGSSEYYMCSLYVYTDNATDFAGARIYNTTFHQVLLTEDNTVQDFTFDSPPSVTNGTTYYLFVTQTNETTSNGHNHIRAVATSGVINSCKKTGASPLTFDDPLTGESADAEIFYILATYTGPFTNTAPVVTVSSENPVNQSIGVGLSLVGNYSFFNISVSDVDDTIQNMNVTWKTNESGSWEIMGTNTSVSNGTYYCTNVSWIDENNHIYWWNVSVDDGNGGWDNKTYYFTTVAIPDITINFAGNLSDSGSPYWRPPDETWKLENDSQWANGYYVNNTKQKEDWIYINCTITDATSVHLDWLNGTTWTNGTYDLTNTGGDFWEINTSGSITNICSGYPYSFNINATGISGDKIIGWNKTGINGVITRRYVYLNNTPTDLGYSTGAFYIYNWSNFTMNDAGEGTKDRLVHDQGTDGTTRDTGMLYTRMPDKEMFPIIWCTAILTNWFDEDVCFNSGTINNVYYHLWGTSYIEDNNNSNATLDVCFNHTNGGWAGDNWNGSNEWTTSYDNAASYFYFNTSGWGELGVDTFNGNYSLSCNLIYIIYYNYTDNSIYEMMPLMAEPHSPSGNHPSVLSNRSFTSFILFNVPDNATLNESYADSDSDDLSDWYELYQSFTNPFLEDTDGDNMNDDLEILYDIDPNNYTDYVLTIIDSSINGSIYNNSFWTIISSSINGSIFNNSVWTIFSDNINGSLFNSTPIWNIFSSSFNGSVFNSTPLWSIFSSSINGSIYNSSGDWNIFSDTINGSIYNISIWQTINSDINGSLFNNSIWQTISDTINGSIYNLTGSWNIFSQNINGSIYNNTALWSIFDSAKNGSIYNNTGVWTIFSSSINGSIYNSTSIWNIFSSSINGSIFNSTGYWQTISSSVNGSLFNNTGLFTIIDSSINGSIYNASFYSWTILDSITNGSIFNSTSWKTITSDINGSIFNSSASWNVISSSYNGSIYNRTDMITFNFISQTPSNIRVSDTGFADIIYNITTGWSGLNRTSLLMAHVLNNTLNLHLNNTYTLYAENWVPDKKNAINRNYPYWFEQEFSYLAGDNSIGDIGEWAVHNETLYEPITITGQGSNWLNFTHHIPILENLFGNIFLVNHEAITVENKTDQSFDVYYDDVAKIRFDMTNTQWFNDTEYNNTYYTLHFNAEGISANEDLKVYFANDSYVSGRPSVSEYCELIGTIDKNEPYEYTVLNSSYHDISFSTDTYGYVGSVAMTENFSFIFTSNLGGSDHKWVIHYADDNITIIDEYHDFNITTCSSISTDRGNTWVARNGTIDAFLTYGHLQDIDRIMYKVYCQMNDTSTGDGQWSDTRIDVLDETNVQPNNVNIVTPNGTAPTKDYVTGDIINVTYTWLGDPNLDDCWINVTVQNSSNVNIFYLENKSITYVEYQLNSTFWYNWDTTGLLQGGPYHINITVTDQYGLFRDAEQEGVFWLNYSWHVINDIMNGSIFNTSLYSWTVIDSIINGSIYNGSGIWVSIDSDINGSIYNNSGIWIIINNDVNGSIYNVSGDWVLIDSVNGSLFNNSYWVVQDDAINGSIYNISIGSWTIFSSDVNGSIFNSTIFNLIDDGINGSLYNISVYSWSVMDSTMNGSIFNISINYIFISDVYPAYNSLNINLQPVLYFTVNDTLGRLMNVSWFYGINNSDINYYLGNSTNITNSTIYKLDFNASKQLTRYWWRIYIEDGYDYINESFCFVTGLGNTSILPVILNRDNFVVGLIAGGCLFFILGIVISRKRRKRNRHEVFRETFKIYRR